VQSVIVSGLIVIEKVPFFLVERLEYVRVLNVKVPVKGGATIPGKVRVAVVLRVEEGYRTKYWMGASNLEQVWLPQAMPLALPMLGNAVWSTCNIKWEIPAAPSA
jgi:hypothetical protein